MPQRSETIGAIAGALAKAQIELVNPEKVADGDHPVAPSHAKPTAAFAMPRLPMAPGLVRTGARPA